MAGPTLAISLSLLMILGPASARTNDAHRAGSGSIKAVVVRSFGQCSDPGGGWTYINENGQSLGSIPVTVNSRGGT